MWSGFVSLLCNWATDIQVFHAADIPPWPIPPLGSFPKLNSVKSKPLSFAENRYIIWLFHNVDKSYFPNAAQFKEISMKAMNVKEKYSLLKDIKADHFYDLLGEVIKIFERDGRVTMYLSDYTAHSLFYNQIWTGAGGLESQGRDGDEYSYIKSGKTHTNDWPGPYGKLSLQLTVFDSHAAYVREKVKTKDWVLLKNVHVKMGRQGGCLEGYLREDKDAAPGKVQVQIIRKAEDAQMNDSRWKDGLRRKLEWWDKFKRQQQKFLEECEESNGKRKLNNAVPAKSNNKKRRKERRAIAMQKVATAEKISVEKLDLNSNGKYSTWHGRCVRTNAS